MGEPRFYRPVTLLSRRLSLPFHDLCGLLRFYVIGKRRFFVPTGAALIIKKSAVINAKSSGLGLLLLVPALATAFLARQVTIHNASAFVFMIIVSSITVGYVVASRWVQGFRPMHSNGKWVFSLVIMFSSICLGIALISFEVTATMSLGQLLLQAF
ncbi:MAG: hypothetical protein JWM99_266 [Verrucomicrobiales bacterium]|nr:hypothetical protein [Verrucomicrobiales bacterium]